MTNSTHEATLTVKHLDHLNLSVADLDRTIDWYGRVFGFEPVERDVLDDGTRWAVLKGGEALLCVYEHAELRKVPGKERQARGLHGLNHFALRITDPEAWERVAAREGVEVNYGGEITWPHSRSWYVNDPTGYEIEVVFWQQDRVQFVVRSGRGRRRPEPGAGG